jgi:hypothetical protein
MQGRFDSRPTYRAIDVHSVTIKSGGAWTYIYPIIRMSRPDFMHVEPGRMSKFALDIGSHVNEIDPFDPTLQAAAQCKRRCVNNREPINSVELQTLK